MNRQYGWYWVWFMNAWGIATWFPVTKTWRLHHTGKTVFDGMTDDAFDKIIETPILNPDGIRL